MPKFKYLLVLIATTCFLSGCSYGSFGVEGLLASPKLTEEQTRIHQALAEAVGKNITLKYPRSGDVRSAFIIENLDDESTDEALAFFQHNSALTADSMVRIEILDQNSDGEWTAIYDLAGSGTDIDKVLISKLGGDRVNIVVGFSSLGIDEKIMQVYTYENRELKLVLEDYYSYIDMLDMNADGDEEIITVKNNSLTGIPEALLYSANSDGVACISMTPMVLGVSSYSSFTKGCVVEDEPALFIDSIFSNGTQATEIILCRNDTLVNAMTVMENRLYFETSRTPGYYCADIDGDGIVEIPVTTQFTGYESYNKNEAVLLTDWYVYEDIYQLVKKYSGYYNVSDGYAFMLPNRWKDLVTVKIDPFTDETVFYAYEGELTDDMTELMRITVAARTETSDYIFDGYEKIAEKGQLDYLVKLPNNRRETLILTIDEVENNFYVF